MKVYAKDARKRRKRKPPQKQPSKISQKSRKPKVSNADGVVVNTQDQVARIYGVSVRTIQHWQRDGMPVTKDKRYDIREIQQWRQIKRSKRQRQKDDSEEWETRYRKAKAEMAEIQLLEKRGELIPRGVVEKELVQISIATKRALLSLPRVLAPQLDGLDVREREAILRTRIAEVASQFETGAVFEKILKDQKNADVNNPDNLDGEG